MNYRTLGKHVAAGAATAALLLPALALAQITGDDRFGVNYGTGAGLGTRDVRATIATIINIALGILGIVALVIILIGGFKWMTAGGNEENVEGGKKAIGQGIVGLIVIFVAFAITKFVFSVLERAT
jgi:hypothetical protein